MDEPANHGHRIAFEALEPGVPVVASDGSDVGAVKTVMIVHEKHLFDGIVVRTPAGDRFIDAPEVDEIYERLVTLKIDGDAAERLPKPEANPGAIRVSAGDFGGGRARRFLDRLRGR